MREAFCSELVELAEADPSIVLLTADLGFRVLEPFADRFPKRFINVGVAEQNMLGIATGLADAGFIPFVYSISTFVSMRAYEFIRNGPVLHHLPVRIIAVGGGFDYGSNGPTHHALEDIGIVRLQPGLPVIVPADDAQARTALRATWNRPEPIFYRLSKSSRGEVAGLKGRFDLETAISIRAGRDVLILALGPCAWDALTAAEDLHREGIDAEVRVMASIGPSGVKSTGEIISRFTAVITVEDHYVIGGLGSFAAEVIADAGLPVRLFRCGVARMSDGRTGSAGWLARCHGIDAESIVKIAKRCLRLDPIRQ